jgi:phage shock protein A
MSMETKTQENVMGSEIGPLAQMRHARTWSQIARLAGEALAALEGGKPKDARDLLTAIRGVALNADREGV